MIFRWYARLRGVLFARLVLALGALLIATLGFAAALRVPPENTATGEDIYRRGILPSGAPLRGERETAGKIEGPQAACSNCHRRSGLGATEGRILIPPITGRYLFRARARKADDPAMPGMEALAPDRSPYDEATLEQAIRDGIGPDGRKFDALMPRFNLDQAAMNALIGYLRQLSSGRVPGVSDETLQFATIITPDADPIQRKGMLAVLEQFFGNKNMFFRGESPPLQSSRNIHYRIARKWQLHIWDLTGPPETWDKQLRDRLRAEPVFAVISGLGGETWAPVHRFCEAEAIPCLLPNVDLPVVKEDDFYSVYFSKGVLLEAQILARGLRDAAPSANLHRVVQVYRAGDIGEAGAAALRTDLGLKGVEVITRPLTAAAPPQKVIEAVRDIRESDVLVLWLRPVDLSALGSLSPRGSQVYVSGLMGGLERAPLPADWRALAHLTYPFDLPDYRRVRMNYPLGWFNIRHIEVVDERVQTDTYLACVILAETLGPMLDNFVREHLVERLETMLSSRILNAYYPRLGLAPGQRFASKGGYIVHFADAQGVKVIADGAWIVP